MAGPERESSIGLIDQPPQVGSGLETRSIGLFSSSLTLPLPFLLLLAINNSGENRKRSAGKEKMKANLKAKGNLEDPKDAEKKKVIPFDGALDTRGRILTS